MHNQPIRNRNLPNPTSITTPIMQPPLQQLITLLGLNILSPRPNRDMRNFITALPIHILNPSHNRHNPLIPNDTLKLYSAIAEFVIPYVVGGVEICVFLPKVGVLA